MMKPQKHDLVLGGNNPPLTNALVLGGIEGVKRRFYLAKSESEKIAILKDAVQYGDSGEDFLGDIFSAEIGKIQWLAAVLISATDNDTYKELLVDYFTEIILNDLSIWNSWKQEIPDIKIYLKKCQLNYPRYYNCCPDFYNFYGAKVSTKIDLSNTNLIKANLSWHNYSYSNFSNANLERSNLSETNLDNTNLNNTIFRHANLIESSLNSASLLKANFERTNLKLVSFIGSILDRATLTGTIFKHNNFTASFLSNLVFEDSNLSNSIFKESSLVNVGFINCNLQNVNFFQASLERITFDNCNLTDANFEGINNSVKVVFRNSNLKTASFGFTPLHDFIFNNVNLKKANFQWCNLRETRFINSHLKRTSFTNCQGDKPY